MFDQKDIERFWALIDKSDGENACWFPKSWAGYDRSHQSFHWPNSFSVKGCSWTMHKFVYQITYGDLPEGLVIRHTCGFGSCVNPRHLTTGTFAQNAWDREARLVAGIKPGQIATYEDVPEYVPPPDRGPALWPKVRARITEQIHRGLKAGMPVDDLRETFESALASLITAE